MTDLAWHIAHEQLAGYVDEQLADVENWSVEAHLDRCAPCRGRLAAATRDTPAGQLIDEVAMSLRTRLDDQVVVRTRLHGRWRGLALVCTPVLRLSWQLAVLALLALAVGLDSGADLHTKSVLLMVAPGLPLVGVAACFGPRADPTYEMTAASALGGLRLLLLRTACIVGFCIPLAAIVGAFVHGSPQLWLLPSFALTTVTLALGSVIGLHRAAVLVPVAWAAAVVAFALSTSERPIVLTAAAQPAWALALVMGAAAITFMHRSYERVETR